MLRHRRRGGQLAREELVYVSAMSWFHLTLESDSAIVVTLNATAQSAADRLAKIGQRVGMAPAPRARELFELADLMSGFLRAIELRFFDTGVGAEDLFFDPPPPAPPPPTAILRTNITRVIDLWQSATGERIKDPTVKVATASGASQPLRIPATTGQLVSAQSSSNGHRTLV